MYPHPLLPSLLPPPSFLPLPQDPAYPPLLFEILEDCWQQEYYLRPSAEHLHSSIRELSELTIIENQPPVTNRHSVLLDSFTLHQEHRASVSHCYDVEGVGFGVCAAVGEENGTTSILNAQYRPQDSKNELQYVVSTGGVVLGVWLSAQCMQQE
jgi:hypothetical protein